MRPYLAAPATGVLAGVVCGLLEVRSPAPPVVALVGLLGILLGEPVVPLAMPLAKRLPLDGREVTASALCEQCGEHGFGRLPGRTARAAAPTTAATPTLPADATEPRA